jgi:hypothetical protein
MIFRPAAPRELAEDGQLAVPVGLTALSYVA